MQDQHQKLTYELIINASSVTSRSIMPEQCCLERNKIYIITKLDGEIISLTDLLITYYFTYSTYILHFRRRVSF